MPPWPLAWSNAASPIRIWLHQLPTCPDRAPPTGRRVAIVGGGPTGLSAAWHLLLRGHACTVFDVRETAGGSLFDEFPADVLPPEVVAAEVEQIRRLGADFELGGPRVDAAGMEHLLAEFDAVLCAVGRVNSPEAAELGLTTGLHGIGVNRFLQTSRPRVFAAGQAARRTGHRVHSVAGGRLAAIYLDQFLSGAPLVRQVQPFSSQVKCLKPEEMRQFMADADPAPRVRLPSPSGRGAGGEGSSYGRRKVASRSSLPSPRPSPGGRGESGLDPRGSRARGRPMLPLRLPQGRQLPLARRRPGTRGPAQPLRRAATRGRGPHRSFLGHL